MFSIHLEQGQVFVNLEIAKVLTKCWSPALKVYHSESIKGFIGYESIDVDLELPQMYIETSILRQATVLVDQLPIFAQLYLRPVSRVVQNRNLVASGN